MTEINYTEMDRILASGLVVAGHRGYKARYPENTLLSFKEAVDRGASMLELDLNMSKDGVLVVVHDLTVDRTTNGTGRVRDLTLAQIERLDAGIHVGHHFSGLHVPTFGQFCVFMKDYPSVLLNVEIKDKTHEAVDAALAVLREHAMVERCVFTCFDASVIAYLHDGHHVRTQGFPGGKMQNFIDGPDGTYSKLFAVGIEMSRLTWEAVEDFRQMGIRPWAYCPDTDEQMKLCREFGITLVTCNELVPALEMSARMRSGADA